MLPNNALSLGAPASALLVPDDLGRNDPLVDYELGGIALSDASQGLQIQNWRIRVVSSTTVLIAPTPYTSETTLFTGTNITEISLSFDQNMRPCVAFIDSGVAKLYWYDPVAGMSVIQPIDSGITSVFVTMDDKRSAATVGNINDILLIYNKNGSLNYRQQRERFQTERTLALLQSTLGYIRKCGMSTGWRVQIQVVY